MVLENKQQRTLGRMGPRTDGPGGIHAWAPSMFQAGVQRKQPKRDQRPILRPLGKDLRTGGHSEPVGQLETSKIWLKWPQPSVYPTLASLDDIGASAGSQVWHLPEAGS